MRKSTKKRITNETSIDMSICLDGDGKYKFDTPIPFFEHMLSHIAKQSLIDLNLKLKGDIGIDCHHSVEDTGIVFGELLKEAVGDKVGINRYGHFTLTMDDVLATVALDLSGRFHFKYSGLEEINKGKFGIYDAELSLEFLEKFAMHSSMNLHIIIHYGKNRHHIHEAIFKCLGRALYQAISFDERRKGILASTKGVL